MSVSLGARVRALIFVFALACLGPGTSAVPARAAGSASVTVVGDAVKVRPGDRPAGAATASLVAARNETRAFQVIVSAASTPLKDLRVTLAGPLVGPQGRQLPSASVSVYREAYIKITQPSDLEGARGLWPDALIPTVDRFFGERRNAFPVDIRAGKNQAVWVDVFVPAGTPAGSYEGALAVSGSGFQVTVPIRLTVIGFTLPSTSSLQSAFGLAWDTPCLAAYHNNCIDHIKDGWRLRSLYLRAALDDRVTIPYPQYQPIGGDPAERRFFERYGLPLLNGTGPTLLKGARLTSFQVDQGADLRTWKQEAQRKGFADRAFDYACDEPGDDPGKWKACKQEIAAAHRVWQQLPELITAGIADTTRFGAFSLVDWLVPNVNVLDDKAGNSQFAGNQRSHYDAFLAQSSRKRLWFYTSCESEGCESESPTTSPYFTGWPGYAIDEPASEAMATGWLAYEYRVTGELYYTVDVSLTTAWTNQYAYGNNGDGTLFYPGNPSIIGGKHPIPVESMRLKLIRDGYQDYEYLRYLALHGEGTQALAIAQSLFPTMHNTARSDEQVQAARARLQRLVEQLSGLATAG